MQIRYLHNSWSGCWTLEKSLAFYKLLGLKKPVATKTKAGASRWCSWFPPANPNAPGRADLYRGWRSRPALGFRHFGHLAYEVENIHAYCADLQAKGVLINRPPRDGRMAFVRSPDNISIEILQMGGRAPPCEPWISMATTGHW